VSVHEEPWAEGTPAWVELTVRDTERARDFYGALFGWDFDQAPLDTSGYLNALKDGQPVPGIGEAQPGEPNSQPRWITYIATDDVDASIRRVTEAGGSVLEQPRDVLDLGRTAVAADPTGAVFGLRQSRRHTGANRVNEPGSLNWNEVMTRDYAAALKFYCAVFGYRLDDISEEGFSYSVCEIDGRPVGGIGDVMVGTPGDVPAHWLTYFSVADTDAAAAKVTELGGTVQRPPWNTEYGRLALVTGPFGEFFALMGPNA
jgi:predicted enzyme related to lactoylglutathione lyase